jgi:hypothetical protein
MFAATIGFNGHREELLSINSPFLTFFAIEAVK